MKYAIIGCGRIAPNHIESAIKKNLEIVGLCDKNIDKAISLASRYNLNPSICFNNYATMLSHFNKKGIVTTKEYYNNFFVSITTDSGNHYVVAEYLLSKAINILCEKPITLSLKEADKLINIAKDKDVIFGVCQQNRLNNSSQLVKRAINENAFGKISNAAVCIRWSREKDYYSQGNWRGKWLSDGGTMMNQCIHGVDLARWFLGGNIESIYSMIGNRQHEYLEVEDIGIAIAKFKNGSLLTIEGTTNLYKDNLEETITIIGENGTVKLDGEVAENIAVWDFKDKEVNKWIKREKVVSYSSVYGDGHVRVFDDIISSILSHTNPYISAKDGRDALENILAIYKSFFTKKLVKFPLDANCSTKDFVEHNLGKEKDR